jgi:hypothetical protein
VIECIHSALQSERASYAGGRKLGGAETQTERVTGIAGLVLLALVIPAIVTEVRGPEPTTSVAEVAAKFASARTDVLISSVLLIGAATAFFVFIVGAAESSRRRAGESLLVSLARSFGVVGVGVLVVYTAIFASLAAFIHQVTDDQIVYAIFRAAYAIDSSGDLFFGLFVATIAVPLAKAGLSGRWFTRFAIFAGALYALGSLSITSPDAGVFGAFEVIGTVLLLVWLAGTSIRLLRADAGAATPVPAST